MTQLDKVAYSVLAYVGNEHDTDRSWTGTDKEEAIRQAQLMHERWPAATIRMSEERYYVPTK